MRHLSLLAVTMFACHSSAAEPLVGEGEAMIQAYFQRQAKEIAAGEFRDIKTRADWEKARPELRRQLLDMLGLWPMPARTDLKATITGTIVRPKFTIEKIHFQSRPGLYVTGNLYLPKPAPKAAPTILYLCGHGNVVKDGVSYGSKVHYQHHPAWFAEHGYVALVIDTLQLSEIPGIHHGTYREGMWRWHALGYTPAGVECWNAMRAIDYLETRPEVDPKRIGVTGRSGGGAYSWWIAATDERVRCAVPVAGIADLQSHLNEGYPGRLEKGVIAGHCDCMFMVNTYRWDFATVAALIAPRPLLLGNSDEDDIFPVPGYRRIADKVRKIYDLYGVGDNFALLETKGKHVDTLELRAGAFRWMNRWLKIDPMADVSESPFERFEPQLLKVFERTPADALNAKIQDYFIRPANIEQPRSPEVIKGWWPGEREKLLAALKEKVFRGWPTNPPALDVKPTGDATHDGIRLRAWDFASEEGVPLRLLLMSAGTAAPKSIVLNVLDDPGWAEWRTDLGPAFAPILGPTGKRDEARFQQNRLVMEKGLAFAAICPRGIGPTKWAEPGSPSDIQIRRRFALIGQTLDGQRVWDVRRAIQALKSIPDLNVPLTLHGHGEMAGLATYAAIFEPAVNELDLWHPTTPILLNSRRHLEFPQAIALAGPRPIRLFVADDASAKAWDWPVELQRSLGVGGLRVRVVGD